MDTARATVHKAGERQTSIEAEQLGRHRYLTAAALIISGAAITFWAVTEWAVAGEADLARPCLPFAAGIALVLCGSLLNTMWLRPAVWSVIALVGQAATLQMIDAGRRIHFQHYRTIPELLANDLLPLTLFAAQSVIVLAAVSRDASRIRAWVADKIGWMRTFFVLAFLVMAGAAVTPDPSIYLTSLLLAGAVTIVSFLNVYLIGRSIPEGSNGAIWERVSEFLSRPAEITDSKAGLDRFVVGCSLFVVVLTGLLSYFVYQSHPHIPDETQYVFQAKYMAAGQLTVTPPAVPKAFSMYMVPYQDDRWYSIFSPAFPAVLSVGVWAGVMWLVNPLLSGLCILLAYLFFQNVYSRPFARAGVILLACSPWFVFTGMSLMSHTFALACSLGAALLLTVALKRRRWSFALGTGLLIGVASLIRPLDGLILAALLGAWALLSSETIRRKLLNCTAMAIGTIATGSLVLPYNRAVTGSWTAMPLETYYNKYFWPGVMSLGFGPNRGMGWGLDAFPGHSPLEAVINTALNIFQVNTELLGWGIGSLALAVLAIVAGKVGRKDIWAIVCIAAVTGSYSLFWYHGGPDFGARYWFVCIVPMIALTVRGLEVVSERLGRSTDENIFLTRLVIAAAAVLCGITLLSYLPWRASDKYYHYLEMQPGVESLARANSFGRSLVLVRGDEHPDYQSAWIYNPLNFDGDGPLYASVKNDQLRTELLKAYSDRPVWVVDGPTITGSGYKVAGGPFRADELMSASAIH
jgi:hypothetical protein